MYLVSTAVILRYPYIHFDPSYTCGMDIWRLLFQICIYFEVEFLPVYYPTAEEKSNARLFAHNVRLKLSEAMNVPLTDFSVDDMLLQVQADEVCVTFETDDDGDYLT